MLPSLRLALLQTYDILDTARRFKSVPLITFGAPSQKPAARAMFWVLSSVGSERRLDRAEVGSSSLPAPTRLCDLHQGILLFSRNSCSSAYQFRSG